MSALTYTSDEVLLSKIVLLLNQEFSLDSETIGVDNGLEDVVDHYSFFHCGFAKMFTHKVADIIAV